MTETVELSIYEKAFAKSDKTDAVLVVDGKKLHVNKALLSYHSDYFNVLFNSDFKERSMEEIPIEDVNFENFATVLSLVHSAPIKYPSEEFVDDLLQLKSLLEIADQFQLPAVKRHIELFLKTSGIKRKILVAIADKYQFEDLMDYTLSAYTSKNDFLSFSPDRGPNMQVFDELSKTTKVKIFHRILEIDGQFSKKPTVEEDSLLHEKTFAKSDKTDAVLIVDGKKLHVNKAVLSYHSDFFNALFNSDFKEKSMEEIEIKDVKFEDFATLLSFIQLKSILPTDENVENVLELADRFAISCVKFFLEPVIIHFKLSVFEDIRIGDKFGMPDLLRNGIRYLKRNTYRDLTSEPFYEDLSDDTKIELLYKYLTF